MHPLIIFVIGIVSGGIGAVAVALSQQAEHRLTQQYLPAVTIRWRNGLILGGLLGLLSLVISNYAVLGLICYLLICIVDLLLKLRITNWPDFIKTSEARINFIHRGVFVSIAIGALALFSRISLAGPY